MTTAMYGSTIAPIASGHRIQLSMKTAPRKQTVRIPIDHR